MLREFKQFALRGNVLDLAVAVILGIAFGAVVTSFVNDILMALIAGIFGEASFGDLTFTAGDAVIRYGAFLNAVVNFLLVALALFFIVKAVNRLSRKPEDPTVRECPFCLSKIPVRATRCSFCTSTVEATTL